MKTTGLNKIPVVVLNLRLELSPILAKLFNGCLKEKCFAGLCKVSVVCLVYKNEGDCVSFLQS